MPHTCSALPTFLLPAEPLTKQYIEVFAIMPHVCAALVKTLVHCDPSGRTRCGMPALVVVPVPKT